MLVNKKCQQRLIIDDISDFKSRILDFRKFLGMYCNFSTLSNSDYKEQYVKFRVNRLYQEIYEQNDTLTFVTIGYDFGKYLDLSIEGNKNGM